MATSKSEAIFESLNLNPQLLINETLNTIDYRLDLAFDYFLKQSSVLLKVEGTDRYEDLSKGVALVKYLIQSRLDRRLEKWEEYCHRFVFNVPEGLSLPKDNEQSEKDSAVFDGLSDTNLDVELNALREKLTLVEKESAELSRELHALEKQSLSSNQSAGSIKEVLHFYNKHNSAQAFQDLVAMAPQLRAKMANLKRKPARETERNRTDKIRVTNGDLLEAYRDLAQIEELGNVLGDIKKPN